MRQQRITHQNSMVVLSCFWVAVLMWQWRDNWTWVMGLFSCSRMAVLGLPRPLTYQSYPYFWCSAQATLRWRQDSPCRGVLGVYPPPGGWAHPCPSISPSTLKDFSKPLLPCIYTAYHPPTKPFYPFLLFYPFDPTLHHTRSPLDLHTEYLFYRSRVTQKPPQRWERPGGSPASSRLWR